MLPKVSRLRPEGKGLTGLGHYRMWTQWDGEGRKVSERPTGGERMGMAATDHSLENLADNKAGEAAGSNEDFSRWEIPGHI